MRRVSHGASAFLVLLLVSALPAGGKTVGWRGDGSGVFSDATPVTEWSETQNLVWKRAMPSWTNASPIVVGGRVVAMAEPHSVLCLDADTGSLLWHNASDQLDLLCSPEEADRLRRSWDPTQANLPADRRRAFEQKGLWPATYGHCIGTTMATPVSDGTFVYASFGTNTVACYALADGTCRWLRWLGPPPDRAKAKELYERFGPGHLLTRWPDTRFVPSPLLAGGRLIVQHGFAIRAFDPDTGATAWEMDYVPYNYGCGTPAAMRLGRTDVLVTARGWVIRADDGKVLATDIGAAMNGGGNSPFVNEADGVVYMVDGSTGGANTSRTTSAVQLTLTPQGDLRSQVLWTAPLASSEGSSLYHDGLVYIKGGPVLDARTGQVLREKAPRLPSGNPSLALAGNHLFCFDGKGAAAVVELGPQGRIVGRGQMDLQHAGPDRREAEQALGRGWKQPAPGYGYAVMWSSPFFAGSRIYLRSRNYLYCIGPKDGP